MVIKMNIKNKTAKETEQIKFTESLKKNDMLVDLVIGGCPYQWAK